VIIIMQRVHVNDATQFALDGKIGGLKFEQIKIPALNEDGTSYWPYKEPAEELEDWKEANPYTFSSQMQQEPTVLGGTTFKGDWWRFWGTEEHPLPKILAVKIYGDTAFKAEEMHDFSVFQAWGAGEDGFAYLLDQVRGKWESYELEVQAVAFWEKWRAQPMGEEIPAPFMMAIEDKASGTGLIQSLQHKNRITIEPIPRGPRQNKPIRANSSAPQVRAGKVFLPCPHAHPNGWLTDYLAEFTAFTLDMTHKHDDQVDPTMDAIHDMVIGNLDFYANAL